MDRDQVNCIHRLYHSMGFTQVEQNELFWCGGDTSVPLDQSGIITLNPQTQKFELPPAIMDLVKRVDAQLTNTPPSTFVFGFPINPPLGNPGDARQSFLAMPYGPKWFPTVRDAVTHAANNQGFECEVTGDLRQPGAIMNQVWEGIRKSDVVVADVTDENANVFFEIGLAHALGKPVIFLTQDSGPMPFDIRGQRRIKYAPDDTNHLETELESAFDQVPHRYPHQDPDRAKQGKPYVPPQVAGC